MKKGHKIAIGVASAIVFLAVMAYLFAPTVLGIFGIMVDAHYSKKERIHLLYKTDHAALLEACRTLIANRHTYATDKSWSGPEEKIKAFIDPLDPKVPPPIKAIKPSYMRVTDSEVDIELHGGFDHYGVIALSKEALNDPKQKKKTAGFLKLIPGLYYFDEYHEGPNWEWQKSLKPSDAKEPAWWKD